MTVNVVVICLIPYVTHKLVAVLLTYFRWADSCVMTKALNIHLANALRQWQWMSAFLFVGDHSLQVGDIT